MGVFSNILGTVGSVITTNMQNRENRRMADLQYQRDIDMWNRQNAYNDPSAQMARLKSAGLNPNMIYGSGGGFTPSAPAPKYNAPNIDYSNIKMPNLEILPMLSMWQDIKNKKVEHDRIVESTKAIEQQRLNNGLENSIKSVKLNSDLFKYGYLKESSPYQLDFLKLRNRQVGQTITNMVTMNEKLGEDIKMSRLRQSYQGSLNSLATKGMGLRTPSAVESYIVKFLEEMGKDKGVSMNAWNKSSKKVKSLSTRHLGPGGFIYQLMDLLD